MPRSEIFATWILFNVSFFCAEITIMRNQFFYWISLKIYPLYARKRKNSLLCFCDKSCVLKKHQICHISQSWDKHCWYIRIGLMRHRNLNTLSYSLYLVMYKYPLNLRQLGLSFSFGEQDENVKHLRKHYSWKWRRVDDDDDEDDDDTGGKKKNHEKILGKYMNNPTPYKLPVTITVI